MSKRILITGSSGFIGFHLSRSLALDGFEIMGIDNLNTYYNPLLKKARLNQLKSFKNFSFNKIDISDLESLTKIFRKFNPNIVVNLAAQAGVRYSLKNPYAYINSNIVGFTNIIELCRQNKVDGLIYASSSSVYGNNKKIPFSVEHRTDDPISIYAATKKSNELIAKTYSHLYGLRTTGLRYFTVYGPWGRPDMAYYIFTKKIMDGESIIVYNNGKMNRDFTYIDDIIIGTKNAIINNYNFEIFNLGNNKSERLMDLIRLIEVELGKKAKIDFEPIQDGDVKQTFADISNSTKKLNYLPSTSIKDGIPKFVDWYKNYIK